MIMNAAELARCSLDKRAHALRHGAAHEAWELPPRGWIRAVRDALGMTTRQLAQRMGVAPSRIPALERAEVSGATTLHSLRVAAEAMNCKLVYALIPESSLEATVKSQAAHKAMQQLLRLNTTMELEGQALTRSALSDERERLIAEWLSGTPARLWDAD
jgi:predicted DNA-binding mobile mystery protein A